VTEEIVTTDSTSERLEIVHNYEISKTVERLVKAHGSVRRLSVAVVLDEVDRRRS
jgi:flagellar biosynthesis/type III secretory pathway M-ring protein FliF/YscJ